MIHAQKRIVVASAVVLLVGLTALRSLATEQTQPKGNSNSKRTALTYDWKPDSLYQWRFEIKLGVDSAQRKFSGISSFTARKLKSTNSEKDFATATAFVVNEDGWLVTCAHVVDNGTTVKVRLGENEYPAEVVGTDATNDLALLKINANNLKPVSLNSNHEVELGQEIRAVGFPLTELLGKSIKISRGSVSGKVRLGDRELYQIDAAINPGNSGGPIVDSRGNVLGVASQKIQGKGVSNIGFCIPSEVLFQFLKESKVSAVAPIANADFDGPTLAREVIPSVALVEVEIGALDQYELSDYSEFDRGSNNLFEMLSHRSLRMGRAKVLIDSSGAVVENQGADTPFLFGPTATLGIIPLPRPWQTSWGDSSEIRLILAIEEEAPFQSLIRSPFGRLRRTLDSQVRTVAINCQQQDQFNIVETVGDIVTIERESVLACTSELKFEQRVKWNYQFDLKASLVTKAHATGSLQVDDKKASSIEIDVTYSPNSDIASAKVDGKKSSSKASNTQIKPAEEMPKELVTALEQLADEETSAEDRVTQLKMLTATPWNARYRQKVVDQISKDLKRKEEPVILSSINALTNWDAATCVDEVVKFLEHKAPTIRQAAVEYLGSMQDGSAATPLVDALKDRELREAIYTALRSIGPTAEAGVIKMLSHSEDSVRMSACSILENIGSQRCIFELQRVAKGAGQDSVQARKTLAKLGASPSVPPTRKPDTSDENPFEPMKKSESSDENPFEPKKKK
jgi:S1-C subfamily serine protease/HEAT repeat protein